MAKARNRKIAVLMAVYNGERFLLEQLNSVLAQTETQIDLFVSDDGSSDATRSILGQYSKKWNKGRFVVLDGPGKTFVENFQFLVSQMDSDAEYVAFCDQDDIWLEDKCTVAIEALRALDGDGPALYCGRTEYVDEEGNHLGLSPMMRLPPSFENALVQSIAGANTMMLNQSAFKMLRNARSTEAMVSHDWWSYLLVSGAGGTVIYDAYPKIKYRQHANNLVGANKNFSAQWARLKMMLQGRFVSWNDRNLEVLKNNISFLSPKNTNTLESWENARNAGVYPMLQFLLSHGIKRQTRLGNITLYVAALLRKI